MMHTMWIMPMSMITMSRGPIRHITQSPQVRHYKNSSTRRRVTIDRTTIFITINWEAALIISCVAPSFAGIEQYRRRVIIGGISRHRIIGISRYAGYHRDRKHKKQPA